MFTADSRLVMDDEPDIVGYLIRDGWHVHWEITVGPYGEPLAWGRTRLKVSARFKAIAAAQRPGILGGAR